jgi:polygalacturonase
MIKNKKLFLIKYLTLLCTLSILLSEKHVPSSYAESLQNWDQLPQIMESINTPRFQDQDFLITKFGAVSDGKTNCTEAFRKAIEACHQSGGGRVVVPEGVYFTGPIYLKSNVNLYISKNATVLFSNDYNDYLPVVYTRFEGVECMNYSPFIYSFGELNIAITGSGTLDGQAGPGNWWQWKGKNEYGWEEDKPNGDKDVNLLFQMAEDGIPPEERIFGKGHYLRTNFIQTYKCNNILIDSVKIVRSPMWVIHPVLCENMTVQNVHIESHGPNNDGCNPESSKNILIKNSYFDTGDDCIAIKSGRNADGRRVNLPSENIIIIGCTMKDGHGGVVIGSEMSGGCNNIFIEECTMDSPNLERALRIKTNSMRGGIVENIYMRDVTVGEVSDAVVKINFNYGEGDVGQHTPIVRNIFLKNITSRKSKYAIYLEGYERSPVLNLNLDDCRFEGVQEGIMLKHYKNLNLENVYINGKLYN